MQKRKKGSIIDFRDYSFYFLALILLGVLVLSYFILKPFLISILGAIILAYIAYPLYKKSLRFLKYENLAAFLFCILLVLIIILPIIFMINAVYKDSYTTYIVVKQRLFSGTLFGLHCEETNTSLCKFSNYVSTILNEPKLRYYIEEGAKKATTYVITSFSNFLFSLPVKIINFFVLLFVFFYLLKDGPLFVAWLEKSLPLGKLHQKHIFKKFNDVTFAVVYGQIMIALIQGILGGIGFWIFKVSSPLFWGVVMAFFALIPYLGPPVVWVPAALLKIIEGSSQNNNALVVQGILLILYGIFVVGLIDNILRPKIIGERAKVHPILILLGVIGGIRFFGFIGLVIGPVILAVMITFIKIYQLEKGRK